MKKGLLLLGILVLASCSSSSDNGTLDTSPSVLLDPISSGGRLLVSSSAEEGLLDAARPALLRTIFTHITDVTNKITTMHGSPLDAGQSFIGQGILVDTVDCENGGTVARLVEIIDENLGYSTQKNAYADCQINGTVLNGSSSHLLIETPGATFTRGLQITANYEALSIDWSDGTRNELTGEFISNTNQNVAGAGGLEGNDYTETYSIDELSSMDSTGAVSVLRNLDVRNSYRSYGQPLEQSQSLEMSGSWAMTSADGREIEIMFDMDHPLLSDVNIGSTGKLTATVTSGETVILETQGGYQEHVVVTRTNVDGATTSEIVQWNNERNLLGRLPRADCHWLILAPVCAQP